jgi:hypothetical protein
MITSVKPVFRWPAGGAANADSIKIESQAIANRAPNPRKLAAALRAIATCKGKKPDSRIANSVLGQMFAHYGTMRSDFMYNQELQKKFASDESAAHLENLIVALENGDIIGAIEALSDVKIDGFMFTNHFRAAHRAVRDMEAGIPSGAVLRQQVDAEVMAGMTVEDARSKVAKRHGIKPRQVADRTRAKGRRGRPKRD